MFPSASTLCHISGIDIATFYYWRPGQNWPVVEREGVASLENSYDLEAGPEVAQVIKNWLSGPYGQILSNSVDIGERKDRRQQTRETPFTYFI